MARWNPHTSKRGKEPSLRPIHEPKQEEYFVMAIRARGETNDRTYLFTHKVDDMLIASSNWHVVGYFKGN